MSASSTSRWTRRDQPYLQRRRLRLEALLGAQCSYCGLSRADGVNLQFHHHAGRDYSVRKLSWGARLSRYAQEIATGQLRYLACDQTGNDCHNEVKRGQAPNKTTKLYEYPTKANEPF